MRRLYTKAYAKLNLSLDITGLRPDGYHELIMVMQTTAATLIVTPALWSSKRSTTRRGKR